MKILHLITRFIKGGADENTLLTVLSLNKKYDVTLAYGCEFDDEIVNIAESNGIKTKCFPMLRHYNPITQPIALFQLYRFIKKNNFDIVHTHSTEAGIVGRFAANLAGTKTIIHTVHGIPFNRNLVLRNFLLFCEKSAAKHTDKIITNADIIAKEYLKKNIGKKHQYATIYSGIDLDKFRIINIEKNPKKIVTIISRLADGKGHDTFIESAKLVLKKHPETIFWIVGKGENQKNIEKLIFQNNLEKNVKLLGHRDDIPKIIHDSYMLVLPSLREGTPRVIFEAMACKKPVIASNVDGIPEQVIHNKTGILIPPKNPELLAKKICFLLDNPKIAERMGIEGYSRVKKFSFESMAEQINLLYISILHR
jgi:glycosyltransferase involved in cell wall biosynthesis